MPVDNVLVQRKSPHQGMTMKAMVKHALGPVETGSSYPQPSTLDPKESHRNYNITAKLNGKNFMGNIITRIVLPHDGPHSQGTREHEQRRQTAEPWKSQFMTTETDKQRQNNIAQQSYVKQRRLNVGSSYGQFYAFMHAMSAAFGNLQQ